MVPCKVMHLNNTNDDQQMNDSAENAPNMSFEELLRTEMLKSNTMIKQHHILDKKKKISSKTEARKVKLRYLLVIYLSILGSLTKMKTLSLNYQLSKQNSRMSESVGLATSQARLAVPC